MTGRGLDLSSTSGAYAGAIPTTPGLLSLTSLTSISLAGNPRITLAAGFTSLAALTGLLTIDVTATGITGAFPSVPATLTYVVWWGACQCACRQLCVPH